MPIILHNAELHPYGIMLFVDIVLINAIEWSTMVVGKVSPFISTDDADDKTRVLSEKVRLRAHRLS